MKLLAAIILQSLVPPTVGFSVTRSSTNKISLPLGVKKISWTDYEHDFIDPITSEHPDTHLEGRMDPHQREIADQYWLAEFEEEKERLHQMNKGADIPSSQPEIPVMKTSYDAYVHKYIDPIVAAQKSSHKSELKSHMVPSKRAEADEFWLQSFMQERARQHKKQTP